MSGKVSALWSTVGKKVVMAATGLAMFVFLIGHLAGNLLLFSDDPGPFNQYSHRLISLGGLLVVVELILLAFFLGHIVSGISVTWNNRKSRTSRYEKYKSAGKPSQQTLSSSTMIWTGIILFIFVPLHVYTFKYGPGIEQGYVAEVGGERVRDLHRLVAETFQNPIYVLWYVGAMVFMGFHLRHGFWSAFQSLGAYHPRYTPLIRTVGYVLAAVLGLGFLAIPIWIYLQGVS